MSKEMKATLQSILNSINNPAFLKHNDEIILVNDLFKSRGFNETNYQEKIKDLNLMIEEKNINNNMIICELLNNDIYLLKQSKQKLANAMALL
jgi:hypothetical protein